MSRILVIDDEKSIREIAADWLGSEGFEVDTAENGLKALEQVRASPPDVIVLDLMMPVMDGWAFAEACHRLTQPAEIPIVVISATHGLVEAARRLRPFGVRATMAKPFDLDVLTATITRLADHGRAQVPWPA
jgi:two-component system chemotaxis response regulator CheY